VATPTFFFYDLETSGLSSADDRIMQFAGQRTDIDLKPLGQPVNLLVKLADDTLPSPAAILTTKITPQKTVEEGITEPELAKFLTTEIFTPNTIITGFNSVRFDDRFIQHLFWRNFYDPYEWMWKDGRSRWDLLDVVRLTRALRPEGINWPVTSDGKPTNRLELITKLNGISHESAHDALSDVNALIDVARLVRKHQPKLFDYLFKLRDKREVKALINPEKPNPFVYASGRYGSQHNFTTVAVPLFATTQGGCVVFDLRYNLTELLDSLAHPDQPPKSNRLLDQLFPHVKELGFNKCPAVAPLSVLNTTDTWQKIDLSRQTIDANLAALHRHPEIITKLKQEFSAKSADFTGQSIDAESSLYDSFIPDLDRPRMAAVREGDANSLADFHPNFTDERLPELLLHYKAKNFPTSLTASETAKWQTYRSARLSRQAPLFIQELNRFAADPDVSSHSEKSYLLEELKLWYESLQDIDY